MRKVNVQLVRVLDSEEAADDRDFGGMALLHGARYRSGGLRGSPGFERLENLRRALDRKILIVIVIHLHGRRAGAGADTFHFLEGKHAVRGSFLVADLQLLLDKFIELVPAA